MHRCPGSPGARDHSVAAKKLCFVCGCQVGLEVLGKQSPLVMVMYNGRPIVFNVIGGPIVFNVIVILHWLLSAQVPWQ